MNVFFHFSALIAGGSYPLLLVLYQRAMDSLVDLGRIDDGNVTLNSTQSPNEIIYETMKDYFYLGSLSIILYWIAWRNWMVSAERQILRIRSALLRSVLRQEIGWFDTKTTGELTNHLVEDVDKVQHGIK